MSEIPSIDVANAQKVALEKRINFLSQDWRMLEEWLGWEAYTLALQILAQPDDEQRGKLYGQAAECKKLILMGTEARKLANPQEK